MAISINSVKRSGELKPTIDLIYAPQGMGKTTLAAGAPDPIFLQTEDGLGVLEVPTFGLLKSYGDVVDAIKELATQPHDFKTVVLDSAGWLEPMVWEETCRIKGWEDFESKGAGYGKGPIAAESVWRVILSGFSYLRNNCNMGVLILAHAQSAKIRPPDGEDYDRYQPKLDSKSTATLQEYADNVFFINTRVSVTRSVPADSKSRGIASGGNQRYVYTNLKPSHMAKRRYVMPDMIPLPSPPAGVAADPFVLFSTLYQHVPYYKAMLDGVLPSAQQANASLPAVEDEALGVVENPFDKLGDDAENVEATEKAEAAE
jgi:hypothetical protein